MNASRCFLFLFLFTLLRVAGAEGRAVEALLFRDATAPVEQRVADLLGRMTPEEKLEMLGGVEEFYLRGVERLGVPRLKMGDGPVGVRNWGPSTLYPATQLLAATWNEKMAQRLGTSLARDSRARGMHISLAPGVNIYRSPLCGRNYEYMGEDPFLASRMAVASIRSVQEQKVAVTVKHFAANNSETRRSFISNEIDERTLREIYLPAFEAAVKEGGAWCMMNAYNLLNGEYCTANNWLNNTVLKGEWGFQGVVMSDWNATHDTVGAALGGLDLEMPGPNYFLPEKLRPAVEEGKVSQAVIDEKVRRILRLIIANGWLDKPQEDKSIPLDDPTSAATALEMAREGVTLLKNEGSLLPLDRSKIKTIVLLGPNAFSPATGLGSGKVKPFRFTTLLDGLKAKAGKVQVVEVPWTEPLDSLENSRYQGKLKFELFAGRKKTKPLSTAEVDKIEIAWDKKAPTLGITEKEQLFARWTGIIAPEKDGEHQFVIRADQVNARVWINGEMKWDSVREATGSFVLPMQAGKTYDLKVEVEQRKKKVTHAFKAGFGPVRPLIPEDKLEALKKADAVVVCAGFNVITGEGEGYDRNYVMPGRQEELIRTVSRLNPRIVVILNAGGAVATEGWIASVPVFLHAFYPGQEGGTALAEILFGDVNPSGRLPFSYEKKWEDCAAYTNYPKDYTDESVQKTVYQEGLLVGYRWFDSKKIEPLFPFGHGLGYSSFSLENLKVEKKGENVQVTLEVKNTGKRAGSEVVQVYVGQPGSSVLRPLRELKGFAKVSLEPGAKKTVTTELNRRAFSYYDTGKKQWAVEAGSFVIEAGVSSRDIRQKQTFMYE